ncbi:mechanosensitive ion channel protein MscS [Trinickia dabaoshanensis]|uniref:Mechanosensitive ion channel protein MscS n=1 Tax=Trinickia dabaoshanensis TaxID=564714 RepID=A0A2N7VDV0_9BURK|nr:mechanosensitive ion channel family protein [Trinickia dabaoshanensis]PMS15315.1 mechanosensitive ion channel protein MscS [Trinickia dabaoshanensis]
MKWFDLNAFMGISAIEWFYAAAAALVTYLLLSWILRIAVVRLAALAERTATQFDDLVVLLLKGTNRLTLVAAALLTGTNFLTIPDKWSNRLDHLWFLVVGFQIASWLNRAVTLWAQRRLSEQGVATHNPVITTMGAWITRTLLWTILVLAVLANMGVDITAFVASLGVGGVAVALAVQNILGDVLASLAIGLDKPFEIGDFIVFNDIAGSIEHIGLKTTRIRSLSGEEIVCGNTALLKNTIHNYKRMRERRIVFGFGVTYDATVEQLKAVPALVKQAVEVAGNTRFDRAHFKAFGASSLDFEVVYYVTDPDYNLYMDVQQRINLEVMDGLYRIGLGFAFPTRTVHLAPGAAIEQLARGRLNGANGSERVTAGNGHLEAH